MIISLILLLLFLYGYYNNIYVIYIYHPENIIKL